MSDEHIIRTAELNETSYIASFLRKMMTEEMEASGGYPVSTNDADWDRFCDVIINNQNNQDFIYKIAELPNNNHKLVGVSEARIINRAFVLKPAQILHIHSVYVDKENRRKGIGKSLLEAIIEWGREKKCEEAELDVFINNSAKAIYEQLRFHALEIKMVRKL